MEDLKKRRHYPENYKKEAVLLVTEHDYSIAQAAQVVGTSEKNLQCWVKQQAQEGNGERLNADERAELQGLRREVKTLRMEKEILKKAKCRFNWSLHITSEKSPQSKHSPIPILFCSLIKHLLTPSKNRLNNMLNLQTHNQSKIPRIKRIGVYIRHKQIFRITQHLLPQTILRQFRTINICF